jgi:serine/threonine-protein kinase
MNSEPGDTRLPKTFGTAYSLERELGRGGMATVYLARDAKHERRVAVKVLHGELGVAVSVERFLHEIRIAATLQHPHILGLIDSGVLGDEWNESKGLPYYVMPFVDGESLRARLDRERQLPVAEALRLAREVADALDYAHHHGVVHRDIKPENVLLQGGHALVTDFGIALAIQHAGDARLTGTGLSLGTPHYMAPEQAAGDPAVNASADIYALGAVTYEMLVGEPPFTGPSPQAVLARAMTEAPRPVTASRRTVPPHVDRAVRTALEKLPADRF